jgi:2-isopropylmalate synthase
VHAAAVVKAIRKGDEWLANRVYSGVPAEFFGRRQIIEIGPMSGQSNVVFWLEEHGISADPELVHAIFARCKDTPRVLTNEEVLAIVAKHQLAPVPGAAPRA